MIYLEKTIAFCLNMNGAFVCAQIVYLANFSLNLLHPVLPCSKYVVYDLLVSLAGLTRRQ